MGADGDKRPVFSEGCHAWGGAREKAHKGPRVTLVHIPPGALQLGIEMPMNLEQKKKNFVVAVVFFLKFSLFLILFILALSQILKLQNFTGPGSLRAGLSDSFLSFFLKEQHQNASLTARGLLEWDRWTAGSRQDAEQTGVLTL